MKQQITINSTGKGFKYTNEFCRVVRIPNMQALEKHIAKRPHIDFKIEW